MVGTLQQILKGVLGEQRRQQPPLKQPIYTLFTDEQRANLGDLSSGSVRI